MNNKLTELALYEPDIPQNTGTILRMADCLGIRVHIIQPCGFIFGGSHMRRAGMDYLDTVEYILHDDYESFLEYTNNSNKRLILATTKTKNHYTNFNYKEDDIIIMGKESKGVPNYIHQSIADKVTIKMVEGKRSLNIAISAGIILSEALRQLNFK